MQAILLTRTCAPHAMLHHELHHPQLQNVPHNSLNQKWSSRVNKHTLECTRRIQRNGLSIRKTNWWKSKTNPSWTCHQVYFKTNKKRANGIPEHGTGSGRRRNQTTQQHPSSDMRLFHALVPKMWTEIFLKIDVIKLS